MTRYDFRETTDFLNYEVPIDELRDDVLTAMSRLSGGRLSKERKDEIWHTLLTCADFLDTIALKEKGVQHEVV